MLLPEYELILLASERNKPEFDIGISVKNPSQAPLVIDQDDRAVVLS
jgi:hypothetical protein